MYHHIPSLCPEPRLEAEILEASKPPKTLAATKNVMSPVRESYADHFVSKEGPAARPPNPPDCLKFHPCFILLPFFWFS